MLQYKSASELQLSTHCLRQLNQYHNWQQANWQHWKDRSTGC